MNTPEEKKAWPPRGYVDRDRWLWINENCDPGDAARDCPVHFIPHNTFQLPRLIPMMSVAEHEATVSELEAELKNWKWEYENLCKFSNQFQDERDELKERVGKLQDLLLQVDIYCAGKIPQNLLAGIRSATPEVTPEDFNAMIERCANEVAEWPDSLKENVSSIIVSKALAAHGEG